MLPWLFQFVYRIRSIAHKWDAQQEHAENLNLIYELREYQDFIDSIPEGLLRELKQRHEEQQQAQEQK